jgi:transglutaminase-like putative cysteine protease
MMRVDRLLQGLTLAIALLGYLPLAPWISPLPLLAFPLALPAALIAGYRNRHLPALPATLLSLAAFAVYGPRFSPDNLTPLADILILLLAIQLPAARTPRHYLQINALSLFALAGSTIFDLSPRFLLYLLLLLFCVSLSLVLLTFHARNADLRLATGTLKKIIVTGLLMPMAAIPLAALLFMILPRTQVPLWNFVNPSGNAMAGYSDAVRPGSSEEIAVGTRTALRVHSENLPPQALYWRGMVFNQIEGENWGRKTLPDMPAERPGPGRRVPQTIYPEDSRNKTLFALDPPLSLTGVRNQSSPDRVYTGRWRAGSRVSYQVVSVVGANLEPAGDIDREFYLEVPAGSFARLRQLAKELFAAGASPRQNLERLQDFYRQGGFRYTTTGLPTGRGALGRFVLEERAGHCEFFAASFAVLARLGEIPARLVGGYHGGDYNELGGYYRVEEKRAHVWVEVLLDGQGWVRIDPAVHAVNHAQALGPTPLADWRRKLMMTRDALEHFWAVTLLNFDLGRQVETLKRARAGLRGIAPGRLAMISATAIAAGFTLALTFFYWRRRPRTDSDRLLHPFLRLARKRLGEKKLPEDLGLFEIAARLGDPAAEEFTRILCGAIFGERPLSPAEKARLDELLKSMQDAPSK